MSKLFLGYMDFSKLLHGFVKIDKCMSLSFYMDLSKFLHGFVKLLHEFVKVVSSISRPLPNKTKLKFDVRVQSLLKLLRRP